MPPHYLLSMARGYAFTITVEALVLLVGLSKPHSYARRVAAGVWLPACLYPFLWLLLPHFIDFTRQRPIFASVGEIFISFAKCGLFYLAFQHGRGLTRREQARDWLAISLANFTSFALGELFSPWGLW